MLKKKREKIRFFFHFKILVDFSLLQKQNESLMSEKEKFNAQQIHSENVRRERKKIRVSKENFLSFR